MINWFGSHKLITAGDSGLAAFISIRALSTLALLAAIHILLGPSPARKAVERLGHQNDCQHRDRNVNAVSHSIQG